MERLSTYLVGIILFAGLAYILIYDPFSLRSTPQSYSSIQSINVGGQNRWDSSRTTSPVVMYDYDAKIYKMWYVGTGEQNRSGIGYATSTNGVAWTTQADQVIFADNDWESHGFRSVHVVKDGTHYYLWYSAEGNDGKRQIGYATSSDGVRWSKSANNPVVTMSGSGAWDEQTVDQPFVMQQGGSWRMWYTGTNAKGISQIGYATSLDGIHWQKSSGNPVFGSQKTWDVGGVSGAFITTQYGGQLYEMWFSGTPKGKNQMGSVGHAYSNDGVAWAEDDANPLVIADKTSFQDPWIMTINSISYIWAEVQVTKPVTSKTIHFTEWPKQLVKGVQALPSFVPIVTSTNTY